MTKAEKAERRRIKHKLQKAVLKYHFGDFRFVATTGQLYASAKMVTDQLLAGRNPAQVKVIKD